MSVNTYTPDFITSIPASSLETQRWDKEWIVYLNTEDPKPFLFDASQLRLEDQFIEQIKNLSSEEIFNLTVCEGFTSLKTWVNGSDLVGKRVMEVGCGPAFLGKQLGAIASKYLGIDYSQLALSIARLVSPPTCDYVHMSEHNRLLEYAGSMDTMVSRFFFIHQNFDNALWVLKLAHFLLKPKGIVSADFYQGNLEIPQGVVFPAKTSLSQEYPSCGFEFTNAEIEELAKLSGFSITSMNKDTEMQRLFVRFEKQV